MVGKGNKSSEKRKSSLRGLIRTFNSVERQVKSWEKPHQIWIIVDPADSGQDAIYLHTPNPNKKNYPYEYDGVLWGGSRLPQWITQEFSQTRFKLGRSKYKGNVLYWAIGR
jgi:hypothetical protein